MKKPLLIAAALAGVVFVAPVFAFAPNEASKPGAVPTVQPVPCKIVNPTRLPLSFSGALINIEFTLDQAGQPKDINVAANDPVVKRQVTEAFRQWRFEVKATPASSLPKRFMLPLQLVPEA